MEQVEPPGEAFHRQGQAQALPHDGQVPVGEGQCPAAKIGRPGRARGIGARRKDHVAVLVVALGQGGHQAAGVAADAGPLAHGGGVVDADTHQRIPR
jgi:hypothetical protein